MFFKFAAYALPLLVVAQGMGGYASAIGARGSKGGSTPSLIPVKADQVGHGAETAKPGAVHIVPTANKDLASSVNGPIKAMTTPAVPHPAFQSLVEGQGPLVLFCSASDCTNGCLVVPLSAFTPGFCFEGAPFGSAAVLTTGGPAPTVEVFVAEEDCVDGVQIDVADTCFNTALDGEPALFSTIFTLVPV